MCTMSRSRNDTITMSMASYHKVLTLTLISISFVEHKFGN